MRDKEGENENTNQIQILPIMKYERYRKFRQETYQMLGKAKDVTFELMDSIMTTRNASCLGDFALSPLFRRKWPSSYESLQDTRPQRNKLMARYIAEIPVLNRVYFENRSFQNINILN